MNYSIETVELIREYRPFSNKIEMHLNRIMKTQKNDLKQMEGNLVILPDNLIIA